MAFIYVVLCMGRRKEEKMGLRFRKSFKIAPGVKLNFGKKSQSITFGGKGVHYTVNSKGKTTKSIGIPGSGLYYTETSNSGSGSMQDENRSNTGGFNIKNMGCLGWILILVLGLIAMTFAIALYPAFWILAIPATIYFLKSKKYSKFRKRNIAICSIIFITSLLLFMSIPPSSESDSDKNSSTEAKQEQTIANNKADTSKRSATPKKSTSDKKTIKAVSLTGDLLQTPVFTADIGTSGMIKQISLTAKENASALSDEQATLIINDIRSAAHQYYTDESCMQKYLWYGYLLDYKYDDADTRSNLGRSLYQSIKNVYCQTDTAESNTTVSTLEQIDASFAKMDEEATALAAQQAQEEARKQAEIQAQQEAQRQAELQAQQEAEAARIAAEQQAAAQQTQQPQEASVWLSATGSKYHSVPDCGNMNPNNARQVSLSEAQSMGYEPCKRCH